MKVDIKGVPFKVDGRLATLRYVDRNGRKKVASGRRGYLVCRIITDALLTGWGHDFEMRIAPDGPWHRITMTPQQAADMLAANPLSARRLKRLSQRPDYVLKETP